MVTAMAKPASGCADRRRERWCPLMPDPLALDLLLLALPNPSTSSRVVTRLPPSSR
jgi:hypothetical protein